MHLDYKNLGVGTAIIDSLESLLSDLKSQAGNVRSFPPEYPGNLMSSINEVVDAVDSINGAELQALQQKVTTVTQQIQSPSFGFTNPEYSDFLEGYNSFNNVLNNIKNNDGEILDSYDTQIFNEYTQENNTANALEFYSKKNIQGTLTEEEAKAYKNLQDEHRYATKNAYNDNKNREVAAYEIKESEKSWWDKTTESIYGAWNDITDAISETGSTWVTAFKSGNFNDYLQALKETGSTLFVAGSSVLAGVQKIEEFVVDGIVFLGGTVVSGIVLLGDKIFGTDNASYIMDGTLDFIRRDLVGEARKNFYENTGLGKWINDNSNLKYDSQGANGIQSLTEVAAKIAIATAATIVTGGAAAPIAIGALYGTGNAAEKYAQSVDRENGESYNYKRALLKSLAGGAMGAAEFYGYGQMGAGMLGVNISPKASTSFAKNFLTTETLTDTASVVIDHGVNVALGDESWQDALIYGGAELALALGMSAIGAKQATNSARAAEAASNISKSLDFKMTETYDGLLRRYGSEFEVDRRIQAIVNTGNWNYLKNYDGLVSNLYEYTGGDVNNLESFLISKKLSKYSDCKLIGTTIAGVGDYSPEVNMFEELNFYKALDISTNTKIYFQQKLDYNKDICNVLDAFEDLKNKSKNIASKIDNIYITDIDCPSDPYWAKVHNNPDFVCAALGGGGDIQFFAPTDNELYLSTIYHEAGHSVDEKCVISNSDKWQQACSYDGEWASYYAMDAYNTRPTNRYAEDFADSVANLRMMGPDEFIKKYQNRAQILYDIAPELFN